VTAPDEIEAIRRLKARYFRLLDTKDWDGLADVFTTDAHIDMRGEGGGVTTGAAEFVGALREVLEPVTTVHHGHMPEIELTSGTTATGIWAMEDELWWPEGHTPRHLHGFGHYHEAYERVAGGWRISSMTLTRLRRELD